MKALGKCCVFAVLGMGFGVVASAQTGSGSSQHLDPPAGVAKPSENPRQRAFQHPLLERPHSNEMRAEREGRIQRRGAQGTHMDGEIERNVAPEAMGKRGGHVTDRRAGGKPSESSRRP